jgi:lambda family phage portal protein
MRRPLRVRLIRATRLAIRELRGTSSRTAFDAAGMHRLLLDWIAAARPADDEIKGELRLLRARARQLARNNSYARRYCRLLVNNVVGPTGIQLQARIRNGTTFDRVINAEIEAAWNKWSTEPVTVDGRLTLRQLENLLVKTQGVDGEAFVRIWRGFAGNPFGLALQTIDADMIDERLNRPRRGDQNEIRMGIEIDSVGRPVGYHVWRTATISGVELTRERYFVPADEMIHLYSPDRVNQTRGVTSLHSIMIAAHMLDKYEESEAVAARVSAAKMGFIVSDPNAALSDTSGEATPAIMDANPGSIEELAFGKRFEAWDPQHPTSQFGAFCKELKRKIASGVSVFYNVLANDAEGVSYSSMRSFSLIERDDWKQIQRDFVDGWRRRLYREWIGSALLTGAVRLPSRNPNRYLDVLHRCRGWDWIDPEKAAKGAIIGINSGLGTRTAFLAERGLDLEDVFQELKRENDLAALYGISIDGESGGDERLTAEEWEEQKAAEAGDGEGSNGDGRATTASSSHVLSRLAGRT